MIYTKKTVIFLCLLLVLFLTACGFTVLSIFQPTEGYTNSEVIVPINVKLNSSGFYEHAFTLSMLVPDDWTIENDQISYQSTDDTIIGNITYNSTNSSSMESNDPAPEGYYWWSGLSQSHASVDQIVTANVIFNTGNTEGDYNLEYHIGDTMDDQLSEYYSDDNPISIVENPTSAILKDKRNYAYEGNKPWQSQTFDVTYYDPTNAMPASIELVLDGDSYDMDLKAGTETNGIYTYTFDSMDAGTKEYYFLANGSLRLPETGYFTSLEVENILLASGETTFTFESDDPYMNAWEFGGIDSSWEIAQPMGLASDPTSAYQGDYAIGTDLTVDGFSNNSESSYALSPYIDARELDFCTVDFKYQSQSTDDAYLQVAVVIDDLDYSYEFLQADTDSAWESYSQDLTNNVAGQIFRLKFIYKNNETVSTSGFTIDNIVLSSSQIAQPYMTVEDEQNTIVSHKGHSSYCDFYISNSGSMDGVFTFSITNNQFEYTLYEYLSDHDEESLELVEMDNFILGAEDAKMMRLVASIPENASIDEETITLEAVSNTGHSADLDFTVSIVPTVVGPDDNYYYVISSMDQDGPIYDWIPTDNASEISRSQFELGNSRSLGFNFKYYYDTFSNIYLNNYGVVSFNRSDNSFGGNIIPEENDVNNLVSLFFAEFANVQEGAFYEENTIINGENAYVLTYSSIPLMYDQNEMLTAQLIFFESGDIKMQYSDVPDSFPFEECPVAIENYDGSTGLSYQQSDYYLVDGLALLFSPNFVVTNPNPAEYSATTVDTDISWESMLSFTSIDFYLQQGNSTFSASDIIYSGNQINSIDNAQLGDLDSNGSYYWKVVGRTASGFDISSRTYNFSVTEAYTVTGLVTDSYTNEPIEGVLVSLMDMEGGWKSRETESTYTDVNGNWSMTLPSEGYYFEFSKAGYEFKDWVYAGLFEDIQFDVSLDRLKAFNPSPSVASRDIALNSSFSWTNPTGFNTCLVEIASNPEMTGASEVYSGVITDNLSYIDNLDYGVIYYWRVTLSNNYTEDISEGDVWSFVSEFPENVPSISYDESINGLNIYKATATSNGYALAGTLNNNNHALVTINNQGQVLSSNTYSTMTSYFKKAIELSNGNFLIARDENTSYINGDKTGLSQVDLNGNTLWSKSYKYEEGNLVSNELVTDMIIDNSGNAVITGGTGFRDWDFLLTKAAMNQTNPIFQITYGEDNAQEQCNSVIQTNDGGYLLTGYKAGTETSPIGNSRVWVIKTNSAGSVQWEYEEGFGVSNQGFSSYGKAAMQDADGNFVITGNAHDNNDQTTPNRTVLIKLNSSGNKIWDKVYPISFYGEGKALALASDNNYLIGGIPELMKVDTDGNIQWIYDDADNDITWNIASVIVKDSSIMICDDDRVIIFGDVITSIDSPENISISINAQGNIILNWDSVIGASSYQIETSDTIDFDSVNTYTTSSTSWEDTNSSVRKFYRIKAHVD